MSCDALQQFPVLNTANKGGGVTGLTGLAWLGLAWYVGTRLRGRKEQVVRFFDVPP